MKRETDSWAKRRKARTIKTTSFIFSPRIRTHELRNEPRNEEFLSWKEDTATLDSVGDCTERFPRTQSISSKTQGHETGYPNSGFGDDEQEAELEQLRHQSLKKKKKKLRVWQLATPHKVGKILLLAIRMAKFTILESSKSNSSL